MCLLSLFFRIVEDAALVVGANREEFYERGGLSPTLREGPLRVVSGVDPRAEGTWFGVNEKGVFVAVTNRPKTDAPAQPRSRGLLVRELLHRTSAAQAVEYAMRELEGNRYAGANFVCADASRAIVLQAGDWLRVLPLPPGIHVLTNRDINDATDARLSYAFDWLSRRSYASSADCIAALTKLCSQHEPEQPPMCFRKHDRGTVSSSIVALREKLSESVYLHAQGPPCQTPYVDISRLLSEMQAVDASKKNQKHL